MVFLIKGIFKRAKYIRVILLLLSINTAFFLWSPNSHGHRLNNSANASLTNLHFFILQQTILFENRLSIALINAGGKNNSSLFKKDKVKKENMTEHHVFDK